MLWTLGGPCDPGTGLQGCKRTGFPGRAGIPHLVDFGDEQTAIISIAIPNSHYALIPCCCPLMLLLPRCLRAPLIAFRAACSHDLVHCNALYVTQVQRAHKASHGFPRHVACSAAVQEEAAASTPPQLVSSRSQQAQVAIFWAARMPKAKPWPRFLATLPAGCGV
jgi:hypothetical protein